MEALAIERINALPLGGEGPRRVPAGSNAGPDGAPLTGLVSAAYVPSDKGDTGADPLRVDVYRGGALIRFHSEKRGGSRKILKKRGKCRGMSRDTRRRQTEFVQSIDRRRIKGVIFATMTLRGSENVGIVESWELIEPSRRKWFKRLEHRLAGHRWFAIWRKEPHPESGRAHLHVLIFFLDDLPNIARGQDNFRTWNDQAWSECVGDPSIRRTACRVEYMREWSGVVYYLAKYLSKYQDLEELNIETGKVWDVVHRSIVPYDVHSHTVQAGTKKLAQRACRKWHQRQAERWEVRIKADDGQLSWRTVRPWVTKSGRRVEIAEQVAQSRAAGLRVRRRRPRLSCTLLVPIYLEEDGATFPAPLWMVEQNRQWIIAPVELKDAKGYFSDRVCERHTYYSGSYFLPCKDAEKLLAWAKCEHVNRVIDEASLPF